MTKIRLLGVAILLIATLLLPERAYAGTCQTDWNGNSYTPFGNLIASDYGTDYYNVASSLDCDSEGQSEVYSAAASAVWATNCWPTCTSGWTPAGSADMQGDGNFVVYTSGRTAKWASNTDGHSGAYLAVRSDGYIAVYSANGARLWRN